MWRVVLGRDTLCFIICSQHTDVINKFITLGDVTCYVNLAVAMK